MFAQSPPGNNICSLLLPLDHGVTLMLQALCLCIAALSLAAEVCYVGCHHVVVSALKVLGTCLVAKAGTPNARMAKAGKAKARQAETWVKNVEDVDCTVASLACVVFEV